MPLLSSSDNSLQILISTKADAKGVKDTQDALSRLSGETEKSSTSFLKLSSAVAAGQAAFSALKNVAGTVTGAIGDAASFEQTRIGLENMLGSADKARGLLGDISKFAAETPFEFPELAQATRQLVAFGFSGQDAFGTMKQLGDVSAAVGAPINDLAYLMGTLRTQGRAFTIDIRQFAQRGIPIYEYLAKVLGTNEQAITKMIEEGKIGFPEVQKAFAAMTGEGGKFNNTMARQSKSLNGLFSTLKDNIGQTTRELLGITQGGDIKEGSAFDRLRDVTAALIEQLPRLSRMLSDFMGDVGRVARQVGDYLEPKMAKLWDTVETKLMPTLTRLWKEVIEPLLPVLGGLFVAAIGIAIDALTAYFDWWSRIVNIMITAKETLQLTWDGIVAIFNSARDQIAPIFQWINERIEAVKSWFNSLDPAIKGALVNVADTILGPFDEAFRAISNGFDAVRTQMSKLEGGMNGSGGNSFASRLMNSVKNSVIPGGLGRLLPGFAAGGYTGAGSPGEIAGFVHKGEYVMPKSQVDQTTGQPKSMGSQTTINYNAPIYLQTAEATNEFFEIQDRNSLLASKGLSIVRA